MPDIRTQGGNKLGRVILISVICGLLLAGCCEPIEVRGVVKSVEFKTPSFSPDSTTVKFEDGRVLLFLNIVNGLVEGKCCYIRYCRAGSGYVKALQVERCDGH